MTKDHIINKLILDGADPGRPEEWSPVSPSIAFCNGNLYLAWKGDYGNDKLNVMVSTDAGASFDSHLLFTSPTETSSDAPALASDGRTLFIAWKGDGNDDLNVATVVLDPVSGAPMDIINKAFPGNGNLNETSPVRPALAVLNGNVYLAWKGDGNDNLNVMVSTDAGASFVNPYTSAETSTDAPALASDGRTLFIAWKGSGNDNLNVARVTTLSLSIINPTNPREFQFTGSGWIPETKVTVTARYDYADSGIPGGIPVGTNSPYPVAADGTFGDTIRQNFESGGALFVEAKDPRSDQSASASATILGG
jgi:hypothetical protein